MEDFKGQLASLLGEGNSIVQTIETSSFIIAFSKAVAPHVLEEEDLEDLENFVETLNLPSPVHQTYVRYIKWNRDSESLFSNFGLAKSFQFKEFVRLRKEVGKEISKKSSNQRVILLRIKEQITILDSLYKLNLEQKRKKTRKERMVSKPQKRKKGSPVMRRLKKQWQLHKTTISIMATIFGATIGLLSLLAALGLLP